MALIWLLMGSAVASPPPDLEPNSFFSRGNPGHPNPGDLDWRRLEYRRERPRLVDDPRPPPPDYAYWYWKAEEEAYRKGLPDPWYYQGKRRNGEPVPQPGVALGDAWRPSGIPDPERSAPRPIRQARESRRLAARVSPDPGFRGGDPDYHYQPSEPASDIGRLSEGPASLADRGPCGFQPPWRTMDEIFPECRDSHSPPAAKAEVPPARDLTAMMARGEKLFRARPAGCVTSCLGCHHGPDGLQGAFPRYPTYNADVHRVVGLEERVNLCRTRFQASPSWEPDSQDLLAILVFLRELK